MDREILLIIVGGAISLVSSVGTSLLGHFLERRRQREEWVNQEKIRERERLSQGIDALYKLRSTENAAYQVESERKDEFVRGLAGKFDLWMKSWKHPDEPDSLRLLDWLVADYGADYMGGDYQLFKRMAEVLQTMGYSTLPPPGEPQFLAKIREHDFRLRERLIWMERERELIPVKKSGLSAQLE